MYEFVLGRARQRTEVQKLVEVLQLDATGDGTAYVGYPILPTGGDPTVIDSILVGPRVGVVLFHVLGEVPAPGDAEQWASIRDLQTDWLLALKSKLLAHRELTVNRELAVPLRILTFVPAATALPDEMADDLTLVDPSSTLAALPHETPMADALLRPLNAVLQTVATIKPRKKRAGVKQPSSRGAILKRIELEIANLDRFQKQSAIETPDGPQRIRGLAGSGKTIVLALKAAYLHAQYPEWRIALTFFTRSLYQQLRDLVVRFYFEHTRAEPDWNNLRILHAWGTAQEVGLYSEAAMSAGVTPKDFSVGKQQYGRDGAFAGVCAELLQPGNTAQRELYDAILVDEAQDLPGEFFRLAYSMARAPKRIIWAYDELQNLSDSEVRPPEELFGADAQGAPLVSLRNEPGQPHQDIILPVCYRNTPWALAVAHSLGFGVYRDAGLVQFFDDPTLWTDVGYELLEGEFKPESVVKMARRANCSPSFFRELLSPADAVVCRQFETNEDQVEWAATSIKENLDGDELENDDILVIFPDPITVAKRAGPLINRLKDHGIPAHITGVTSSRDVIFQQGSVAISGIFRAKGNEAPMVYALDSQYCYAGYELIRRRNTVFTAITRSRAWVRIAGVGGAMESLAREVSHIVASNFELRFRVPTNDELAKMRRIHREMTSDERRVLRKTTDALSEAARQLASGDLAAEHLPKELRDKLRKLLGQGK